MPGILGFYCKDKGIREENASMLNKMIRSMKHEDHYIVDTYIDDHASIGRIGLGVINSEPQPVWSEDKRYCLIMDGQIYDYDEKKSELKKEGYNFKNGTEEEVIVHLFHKYGKSCVKYLKGIFVVVIYDTKDKILYFINDRYGYRNLYYFENHRYLVFASEIKAILATGVVNNEVDEGAICDMLNFHFIIGDKTFFKNIKLLRHGNILEIEKRKSKNIKYWNYPEDVVYSNDNLDTLIEKGTHLIRKSILQNLKKGLNIGVTLSGGLDSRIISAFLAQQNIPFTMLHFGNKSWSETKIANKIAEILNRRIFNYDSLNLNFLNIAKETSFLADGQYSSEQYIYQEMVKNGHKLYGVNFIFHGLALDILFGGPFMLLKDNDFYKNKDIVSIMRDRYRFLPLYLAKRVFRSEYAHYLDQMSYESIKKELENFPKRNYAQLGNYFYLNNRGRRLVLGTPVVNQRYVEYAFPGLDYDLYDFAITVPPHLRVKRDLYRAIFLRNFNELSKIPYAATSLPLNKWQTPLSRLRTQIKKSFYYVSRLTNGKYDFSQPVVSYDKRFRKDKEFKKAIIDYLSNPEAFLQGYLTLSGLNHLITEQSIGKNYFKVFNTLITIQLFFEQHFTYKKDEETTNYPHSCW